MYIADHLDGGDTDTPSTPALAELEQPRYVTLPFINLSFFFRKKTEKKRSSQIGGASTIGPECPAFPKLESAIRVALALEASLPPPQSWRFGFLRFSTP